LHLTQNICVDVLQSLFYAGILRPIDEQGTCPPIHKEFDVQRIRVISGSKAKRQALAMSLRALSLVLGTSAAACPVSAPFDSELHDWNTQATGSILGGDG
jgi:hypothetical protein